MGLEKLKPVPPVGPPPGHQPGPRTKIKRQHQDTPSDNAMLTQQRIGQWLAQETESAEGKMRTMAATLVRSADNLASGLRKLAEARGE